MTRDKKDAGYLGEALAARYYQDRGYTLIMRNYTIAGGELDLIVQKDHTLVFVEVKVVDHIDDLFDYITPKKLGHLYHTINHYLTEHPSPLEYTLDVVFVKDNSIFNVYENVTNM